MPNHDLITIGCSMGGVNALNELVAQLPADLPAAVCVVLHISPDAPGLLHAILNRHGPLPAQAPENGQGIERGHIYVARPDHHLIVRDGRLYNTRGPRENRVRPAIDPLFRSAAVSYGARVIGVILTGLLDDGTAGLLAIKRVGGLAVVQDPADAEWAEMPESALAMVPVDHTVPLAELGPLLTRLAHMPAPDGPETPRDMIQEVVMADESLQDYEQTDEQMGELVPFVCPECGGPLWELHNDDVQRYRCKIGHAYTARTLLADHNGQLEGALWAALRAMEERSSLLHKMAAYEQEVGREKTAARYRERATEARQHALTLRQVLIDGID